MTLDEANLTTTAWELEQRIRLAAPHYTELLRTLVRTDSGPGAVAGIHEIGGAIAARLRQTGFSFEELPVPSGEPAPWLGVQARQGGHPGGVLFVARLDTRWADGTSQVWPFLVNHGIASGPGVGEMKGGLVTAVAALEALDAVELPGPELIVVLLLANGDTMTPEAGDLVRDAARMADWAASLDSPSSPPDVGAVRQYTPGERALYHAATAVAAELGIDAYVVPSAEPHSLGAPAAATGIPVLTNAGPVAKGVGTRDESIDLETLFGRAALLATLMAAYDPRRDEA